MHICEKIQIPKTKTRNKLIRARQNFSKPFDNPNVSLKIVNYLLFTRKTLVAEPYHQ